MPDCERERETSTAVSIVFGMVDDLMWKIRRVDGIEKQQELALQLFKYLGSVATLEEAAEKMLAVGMAEDKQETEEMDDGEVLMESMYID